MNNPLFNQYHNGIVTAILTGDKNLIVEAGPGSGKTWSVKNAIVPALLEKGAKNGRCIAFNGKNAYELKAAIQSPKVECSTVHSLGLSILRAHNRYLKVDTAQEAGKDKYDRWQKARNGKALDIAENYFPDVSESDRQKAVTLADLMKVNGFGLPGFPSFDDTGEIQKLRDRHSINSNNNNFEDDDSDRITEIAIEICKVSVRASGSVDFADMLYLPLYLNLPLPHLDFVVYDEGQDCKPAELELLKRFHANGARIVIVGDGNQGINLFAGAMPDALERAAEVLQAQCLPLPVSFRCSQAAANLANGVFPNSIIAGPNAKPGSVKSVDWQEFVSAFNVAGNETGALSRVHRYLLPLALALIRQQQQFRYKGVQKTVDAMERHLYHAAKQSGDLSDIRRTLTEKQAELEDRYAGKKMPKWVQTQGEVVECLSLLMATVESNGGDMATVKSYLKALSKAEKANNGPTLSTIHAAKGMEWPVVYLIGALRSTLAETDEELRAEQCAEYVALTRSSDRIITVTPA